MCNCKAVLLICCIDYSDGEKYIISVSDSECKLPTCIVSKDIEEEISQLFTDTMSYSRDWINTKLVKAEKKEDAVVLYYFFKVPKTESQNWVKTSIASVIYPNIREIFLYV
jgi:hypothetical protein